MFKLFTSFKNGCLNLVNVSTKFRPHILINIVCYILLLAIVLAPLSFSLTNKQFLTHDIIEANLNIIRSSHYLSAQHVGVLRVEQFRFHCIPWFSGCQYLLDLQLWLRQYFFPKCWTTVCFRMPSSKCTMSTTRAHSCTKLLHFFPQLKPKHPKGYLMWKRWSIFQRMWHESWAWILGRTLCKALTHILLAALHQKFLWTQVRHISILILVHRATVSFHV